MLAAIKCRLARPEEAEALSVLCLRSKAHWGYDADFMRLSLAALCIDAAAIAEGRVLVAVDATDSPLGVVAVALREDGAELTHLFVEPGRLGQGIGTALFAAALRWTLDQGRKELLIASDPNATGFYAKMGAVNAGMVPSDAILGRVLPLLRCIAPERL